MAENQNDAEPPVGAELPAASASDPPAVEAGPPSDAPPKEIDLTQHDPVPPKDDSEGGHPSVTVPVIELRPRDPQEEVRGDLARGLLWLLTLTIGGMLLFVGTGKIKSDVLTQSIFPSLVTLTGTALGFYFGAQSSKDKAASKDKNTPDP